MAQIDFEVTNVCAGGGHITITATKGSREIELMFHKKEFQDEVSGRDAQEAIKVLILWAIRGLTPAQAKAKIDGMSITL